MKTLEETIVVAVSTSRTAPGLFRRLVRDYRPRCFLDWLLLVVICLLIPVYSIYLLTPAVGLFHDEGIYLTNAVSLITGHGYRTISLPAQPFQTKYPIMYPALLALLWKLFPHFPQNVPVFKLFSMLGTLFWLGAVYKMVLAEHPANSRRLALWIATLTACSEWVIFLSASALPDTLFCFCTTAALVVLTKTTGMPDCFLSRGIMLAATLSSIGFLLRTATAPLILAAAFVLLARKRPRFCVAFLSITILIAAPWVIWQTIHPALADPVQAYYTKLSYTGGHIFSNFTFVRAITVVSLNALLLFFQSLPASHFVANPASLCLGALAGVLALTGLIKNSCRGLTILNTWIILYSGMLLCWVFTPSRYEVALYPFLYLMMWHSISYGLRNSRRIARVGATTVLLGLLVLNGEFTVKALTMTLATGTPSRAGVEPDDWSKVIQLSQWIRNNTPRSAVLAGNFDPALYLLTGRTSVRLYATNYFSLVYGSAKNGETSIGTVQDLKNNLLRHHVSFIVMTPSREFIESSFVTPLLAELIRRHPGVLSVAYRLTDARYFILAVHADKL